MVPDILDVSAGYIDGGPYLLTDGEWMWWKELAYYVEHYHISLPDDFVAHMQQNNFVVREISDEEICRLTEELIAQKTKGKHE